MASPMIQSYEKHMAMDVEAVLHMKEGLGETSYAQNSSLQVLKRALVTSHLMLVVLICWLRRVSFLPYD